MTALMEHPTDPKYPGGAAGYADRVQHRRTTRRSTRCPSTSPPQYDIVPNADTTRSYTFNTQQPVNNKSAKIHGFEIGGQHFFGDTGFGVLANYTIVKGDVGLQRQRRIRPPGDQFALLGLSDSGEPGADVREVRVLGPPGLQLARQVPQRHQPRQLQATRCTWRPTSSSTPASNYNFSENFSVSVEGPEHHRARTSGSTGVRRLQLWYLGGAGRPLRARRAIQVLTLDLIVTRWCGKKARWRESAAFFIRSIQRLHQKDDGEARPCSNNVAHKNLRVITRHSRGAGGQRRAASCTFPTEWGDVQREYPHPVPQGRAPRASFHLLVAAAGLREARKPVPRPQRLERQLHPGNRGARPVPRSASGRNRREPAEPVIHVDLDHPRISTTEGEPVFLGPNGGNTRYIERIAVILEGIRVGLEASKAMFAAFAATGPHRARAPADRDQRRRAAQPARLLHDQRREARRPGRRVVWRSSIARASCRARSSSSRRSTT